MIIFSCLIPAHVVRQLLVTWCLLAERISLLIALYCKYFAIVLGILYELNNICYRNITVSSNTGI